MACNLKPTCDFIFGFLRSTLSVDTLDIQLMIRTVQGIHTFRKDHTTESATCSPWNKLIKPFPSLQKKVDAFKEEKKDGNIPFHPNPIKFTKKDTPTKRFMERSHRRSKKRKLDMGILPHQGKEASKHVGPIAS